MLAAGRDRRPGRRRQRGDRRRHARVLPGRGPPGPRRRRRPRLRAVDHRPLHRLGDDASRCWTSSATRCGRGAADEDRRPRRRPDRRLDRARRPAAAGGARWSASTPTRRRSSGRSRLGAIDRGAATPAEACEGAEVVFCAAPVAGLTELAAAALDACGADTVVTDVGSTKRDLVAALGGDERFIGGHPLAGAETAGVENARADLFEGARWYLTPNRALQRHPLRPPAARRRRARRPPAGDRRRGPRPPDGDGQPPAPRRRQRPRRPGRGGADPRLRADARGRPELPRHDPRRRRQPGDLGRHLRQQQRGGGRGGRRASRPPARGRRADPRGRARGGRRVARRRRRRSPPPARGRARRRAAARAARRRRQPARARSPSWPWPSARPASTSRTWRSTRRRT